MPGAFFSNRTTFREILRKFKNYSFTKPYTTSVNHEKIATIKILAPKNTTSKTKS